MAIQKSYKGQYKRPVATTKPHPRPNKGKPIKAKARVSGFAAAPRAAVKAPKGGRR